MAGLRGGRGRPAWQLALVGIGAAIAPLDTAVNIAFPAITRGFALEVGDIQWVVIAYVLTYSSLLLAFGRIGDILGHAAIFRLGLAWSTVALLLCAAAPGFGWLLAARVLQGIGAGLVLSCAPALATSLYPEERRTRVLGVFTMIAAIGSTLGPFVGGALTAVWDWPAVFWYRAPIALAVLLLLRDLPAPAGAGERQPLDLAGAALLVLALVGLLLGLNRLGPFSGLALWAVAALAAAGFVRQELTAPQPVLDLRVFRTPGFLGLNLANGLVSFAAFAVWLLVPFYLARATTLPLSLAGAVLATGSIGAVIASPLGGWLVGRISAERFAFAGALLVGIGLWLIGSWQEGSSVILLIAALLLQGVGLGCFQLAYTDIVLATLPPANRGVAGSLAMVTRTIGTAAAASMMALVFQSLEAGLGFLPAFRRSFEFAALLPLAVAALLALRFRRRRKSQ